jgi:hypothetical protein
MCTVAIILPFEVSYDEATHYRQTKLPYRSGYCTMAHKRTRVCGPATNLWNESGRRAELPIALMSSRYVTQLPKSGSPQSSTTGNVTIISRINDPIYAYFLSAAICLSLFLEVCTQQREKVIQADFNIGGTFSERVISHCARRSEIATVWTCNRGRRDRQT